MIYEEKIFTPFANQEEETDEGPEIEEEPEEEELE